MSCPNPLSSTPNPYPAPYVYNPVNKHTNTLILLHGTSQDGHSFGTTFLTYPIPIPTNTKTKININQSNTTTLPSLLPNTRFVLPTGKPRYCTVLGRKSSAWFDFASFADRTVNEAAQVKGLRESVGFLGALVEGEVERLVEAGGSDSGSGGEEGDVDGVREWESRREDARRKVVLGGFSQGSAMACIALLSGMLDGDEGGTIGGFVGLSGWLPFRAQMHSAISSAQQLNNHKRLTAREKFSIAGRHLRSVLGLPVLEDGFGKSVQDLKVFLGHGEGDLKMKPEWGREMGDLLVEVGMSVGFKACVGLEHWWNEEVMRDLVGFLRGVWDVDTSTLLAKTQ